MLLVRLSLRCSALAAVSVEFRHGQGALATSESGVDGRLVPVVHTGEGTGYDARAHHQSGRTKANDGERGDR